MHGPDVWELWNVKSNRLIEIQHHKSKCLYTGDEFTIFVSFDVSWPEFNLAENLKVDTVGQKWQQQVKRFRKSCSALAGEVKSEL